MKMPVILSLCALLLVNSACASPPVRPQEGVSALADDGSWCWFGDPRTVSFTGKRSRTYVGTLTSTGNITIMALDNKTGELENCLSWKKWHAVRYALWVSGIPARSFLMGWVARCSIGERVRGTV